MGTMVACSVTESAKTRPLSTSSWMQATYLPTQRSRKRRLASRPVLWTAPMSLGRTAGTIPIVPLGRPATATTGLHATASVPATRQSARVLTMQHSTPAIHRLQVATPYPRRSRSPTIALSTPSFLYAGTLSRQGRYTSLVLTLPSQAAREAMKRATPLPKRNMAAEGG